MMTMKNYSSRAGDVPAVAPDRIRKALPAGAAVLIEGLVFGYRLYRATPEAVRRSRTAGQASSRTDVPWFAALHVVAWLLIFIVMAIGGYLA